MVNRVPALVSPSSSSLALVSRKVTAVASAPRAPQGSGRCRVRSPARGQALRRGALPSAAAAPGALREATAPVGPAARARGGTLPPAAGAWGARGGGRAPAGVGGVGRGRRGTLRRAPSRGGGAELGDLGADLRRLLRGRRQQLEHAPPAAELLGGVAAPASRLRGRGQLPELHGVDEPMAGGAGEESRRHLGAAGAGHRGRIGAAESASVTEP